MSETVKYSQGEIRLDYSDSSLLKVGLTGCLSVDTMGCGEGKNYRQAEQEAQLYLIRNAILKKPNCHLRNPRCHLKEIVGIKQETSYNNEKEGIVKIVLSGTAIFK